MYFIKEMPAFERPREKLLKHGAKSLSNIELIAILLRTGNSEKSVLELSKEVVYQLNEISDLRNITIHNLLKVKGIKTAKASTIMAAIELGSRLNEKSFLREEIESTKQVYEYMEHLKFEKQENLYCLFLNTKLAVIDKMLIYKGTANTVSVDIAEVLKAAIDHFAKAIILVHNHPTGNATPSDADKQTTKKLSAAAKLLDIHLLDHVIIGNNQYYSFKENKKFYL